MIKLTEHAYHDQLKQILVKPPQAGKDINLWWLGQAGFAFRYGRTLGLIDPYLSDFLSEKYKNTEFPHIRMIPPPIEPFEVRNVSIVLCTHKHSDHMDPETLPLILENSPQAVLVLPTAEKGTAGRMGISNDRMKTINAGERHFFTAEISITAIAAAHEEQQVDADRNHHFLGYILKFGDRKVYHSGDCIPYPGLENRLAAHQIDLALLPVNGRDQYRRRRNIPGNFTLTEAIQLCRRAKIPVMIGHHFGMFDFNTVDLSEAQIRLDKERQVNCFLAEIGKQYVIHEEVNKCRQKTKF